MKTPNTISARANEFLDSVLDLRPRIAVFDCDGTLWPNNSGEDFFYWSMEEPHRLVSEEVVRWARLRYDEYLAGGVDETVMCGEMTTMYQGLSVSELDRAAASFFSEKIAQNIFPEMLELTRRLADSGCELWAVSSTNEWAIRAGLRDSPIPGDRQLAATVRIKEGIATSDLIRVPSGEGKAAAVQEIVRHPVDAVFGNSIHDTAMLEIAKHAFAVNPNKDLEQIAREKRWLVYWPEKTS